MKNKNRKEKIKIHNKINHNRKSRVSKVVFEKMSELDRINYNIKALKKIKREYEKEEFDREQLNNELNSQENASLGEKLKKIKEIRKEK